MSNLPYGQNLTYLLYHKSPFIANPATFCYSENGFVWKGSGECQMKRAMRVLHVIGGGEFGGAEQHILNLLSTVSREDVEAKVICFYDSVFASKLREAGIPVETMDRYGRFDLRLLSGLQRAFRDSQPDIIHTHGIKANFFGRWAARGLNAKLVTTVHSLLRYDYTSVLSYTVAAAMERITRGMTDHFIAVSRGLYDILLKEGIPPEKISLIYNGIRVEPFRRVEEKETDRARLFAEWNIPTDAFVFGTVARFVPVKGLPLMIQAFADLVKADGSRSYRLVLVGDGPERSLLEATAHQAGVSGLVTFAGFRRDIPACLHAFDCFVLSSLHEGLAYTVLEAVASEVPVCATAVGGIKEFVQANETGLLVESGNVRQLTEAMQQIANDQELRQRLVTQAFRRLSESFTIEQMAAQTVKLYRQILAGHQE